LFLALQLAPAPKAQTSTAPGRVSISHFGRVSATYYRGGQPIGRQYAELAALGVRAVVDLKHDGTAEATLVRRLGMSFYSIPMTTSAAPSDAQVIQFLKIVNDPANQPVFVHCEGGHDRTGAMTAIYRLTHDRWPVERAYAEMKRNGYNSAVAGPALKTFVFDYARRFDLPGRP